jgi:stage V sporulation protein B
MSKDNSFLKGAAILGMAGIVVKILGAIYRIPLSNIITDEGLGYFQTAHPLYVLLLTISTAGFPVAIAKLVSEKRAIGDYRSAHKVFKVALIGLIILGALTSLFVLVAAKSIVESIGNPNAYYSFIALVPALFFVPIMSAFRGLFQGRQTMGPTAISQTAEQFFRVVVGLTLTYFLLDKGIPIAAGGASFGGSAGALVGAIVIIGIYFSQKKTINNEINSSLINVEYNVSTIVKDLLIIAIPITIGSAINPIMDTIDTALVLNRLQSINYTQAQANDLYGQLKGFAQTLINLPQIFSVAIAMSIVPAIANAMARQKKNEIKDIISSGIRITLLIGLPAAFGLFVLARPIIELLYYKNSIESIISTGRILQYLSFGVISLTLVQALTAILQGLGKPIIPVLSLLVGAIAKVFLTYTLTVIPSINIRGAAISTVAAYTIAAIINIVAVAYITKIKFNYRNIFLKPLVASLGMAIVAKLSYMILFNIIGGRLSTVVSILLAAVVYIVLLVLTGSITPEDMALLPKGDKIKNKLGKYNIFDKNKEK